MVHIKRIKAADGEYSEGNTKHRVTVPEGEIWVLLRCSINSADSATRTVKGFDVDNDCFGSVIYASAGTGLICGPNSPTATAYLDSRNCIFFEGEVLEFVFSAAQTTGGDYIEALVLVLDSEKELHLIL